MKNFKKLSALLLAVSMSMTVPVFASANELGLSAGTKLEEIENLNAELDEVQIPKPFASERTLSTTLTGSNGSQLEYFTTSSASPYYKVWVENASSVDYTVTITKGGASGTLVTAKTVKAGQQENIYGSSIAPTAGTWYISVTSKGGVKLTGNLAVRIATVYAEL